MCYLISTLAHTYTFSFAKRTDPNNFTGKTTLLKQILQSKHHSKLRIAIIVNDMGAINLDASEIKKHKLIQEKAEMVEMHNGCICCTLRGDLLKTVKALAEEGKYDYLVIESTGVRSVNLSSCMVVGCFTIFAHS